MPLVPAICTQCGAQIEVDNTHEAGICKHCGTAFITEKAINNYNTHITNNFAGATVHMHEESELERLISAADTFRNLGDNKSAAQNYKEAFTKYPQDARGWVGYIYTSEEFTDFFSLRPFSKEGVNLSLHEHRIFKTACLLADSQTKEKLELVAKEYQRQIAERWEQVRQEDGRRRQEQADKEESNRKWLEDYHANYSLEGLTKAVGSDIYCYVLISEGYDYYLGYYDVLFVRDGILYHGELRERKSERVIGGKKEGLIFDCGRLYKVLPMEEHPRGKGFPTLIITNPPKDRDVIKTHKYNGTLWELDYSNKEEIYINRHDLTRKIYKKLIPSPMLDKVKDYIAKSWEQYEAEMGKQKGCYIATCVYGSYDCPQVWTLRRFRDNTLDSTWYGKLFIKCYYGVSPTLVKWFGNQNWFRTFWKKKLDCMVSKLNQQGVEDTKYSDKY